MRRLFEGLNRPLTVVIALILFLAIDGVLLYLYQQRPEEEASVSSPNTANQVADTTAPDATTAQASGSTTAEETTAQGSGSEETDPGAAASSAETGSEDDASASSEEADSGEDADSQESAGSGERASSGGGDSAAAEEIDDVLRVSVGVEGYPTWLQVQEDGQVVFEQVEEPGFTGEFVADQTIVLRTGNAGATRVTVEGRDQGYLGASGEVATRTYTKQEVQALYSLRPNIGPRQHTLPKTGGLEVALLLSVLLPCQGLCVLALILRCGLRRAGPSPSTSGLG